MSSQHTIKLLASAVFVTLVGPATGAPLPKDGRFDFYHCMVGKWTDLQNSPALQVGYVHDNFASTLANPPGAPFDQLGGQCTPIYLRKGDEVRVDGYCRYADADGDAWIMKFTDLIVKGQSHGTFEQVAGTGKYETVAISGQISPGNGSPPPAQPGMFNRCTRVTGSWRTR